MPADKFSAYRKGMEVLTAQEALMMLKISCAPSMKKEARERLTNRLSKAANPNPQEAMPMTAENLARILHG
jgi:hypothetical protein